MQEPTDAPIILFLSGAVLLLIAMPTVFDVVTRCIGRVFGQETVVDVPAGEDSISAKLLAVVACLALGLALGVKGFTLVLLLLVVGIVYRLTRLVREQHANHGNGVAGALRSVVSIHALVVGAVLLFAFSPLLLGMFGEWLAGIFGLEMSGGGGYPDHYFCGINVGSLATHFFYGMWFLPLTLLCGPCMLCIYGFALFIRRIALCLRSH